MKIKNLLLILGLLLVLMLTPVRAEQGDSYRSLTSEQKSLLNQAYHYGSKFDLGYSLAAIAWQESFVGDRVVYLNMQDPSAGLWHKQINYALRYFDIKETGLEINRMAQHLIDNMDFAAALAVADVLYWLDIHDDNWPRAWASYNAGYNYNSKAGKAYSRQIVMKVKKLKFLHPFDDEAPSTNIEISNTPVSPKK